MIMRCGDAGKSSIILDGSQFSVGTGLRIGFAGRAQHFSEDVLKAIVPREPACGARLHQKLGGQ